MKRILAAAVLIAVMALSGVACATADDGGDQEQQTITGVSWAGKFYTDIGDLGADADLVAVGEIDRVISETGDKLAEASWGDIMFYTTDFAFRIEQLLKGEEAEEVLLHQSGAAGKEQVSDDPLFKPGERYLLFLREYEPGKYFVLGGPQGRFKIIDGKVFSMNHVLPDEAIELSPGMDFDGVDLESVISYLEASLEAND